MTYVKTEWSHGDVVTAAKANNLETQYGEAIKRVQELEMMVSMGAMV